MQKELEDIQRADLQLVAVSYDSVATLAKYGEKTKITFPLLSDPSSKTIDAYGIRNKDVPEGSRLDGIPHPGTFVIDQERVIRAKLFFEGYRQRHSASELVEAAEKLKESATAK